MNAAEQLNRVASDPGIPSLRGTQEALLETPDGTIQKFKEMLADYLELEDIDQIPDYDLTGVEVPRSAGGAQRSSQSRRRSNCGMSNYRLKWNKNEAHCRSFIPCHRGSWYSCFGV